MHAIPRERPEYRLQTECSIPPNRRREVVPVSAQTRQQRLDGGPAPRRRGKPPKHARTGYAALLWRAPPETEWSRVVAWCRRAEAEGVI